MKHFLLALILGIGNAFGQSAQHYQLDQTRAYMYSDYCEDDDTISFYLCADDTCKALGPGANIPYRLVEKLKKDEGLDRIETIGADVLIVVGIFLGGWTAGGLAAAGPYYLLHGLFTTPGLVGAGAGLSLGVVTTQIFDPLNPVHQFREYNILRDAMNNSLNDEDKIYENARELDRILNKLKTKKKYIEMWSNLH